jgi:hypothetical protein
LAERARGTTISEYGDTEYDDETESDGGTPDEHEGDETEQDDDEETTDEQEETTSAAFVAELTGATGASGIATVDIEAASVHYRLDVDGLCDPTGACLRFDGESENGSVFVRLTPDADRSFEHLEGRVDGTLAAGELTSYELAGLGKGPAEAVAAERLERGASISVETASKPDGEIGGRVEAVS